MKVLLIEVPYGKILMLPAYALGILQDAQVVQRPEHYAHFDDRELCTDKIEIGIVERASIQDAPEVHTFPPQSPIPADTDIEF